jgi:hypothetical protein
MEIVIIVVIGLIAIGSLSIMSMIKCNSNFHKASQEVDTDQLQRTSYAEKVEKHKKMMQEADENPEYIQKNNY